MMNIVTITKDNLSDEHICCAISNNNDIQVSSKKAWLAERLSDGLVFKKGDVRGKCFIEYIPAEKAWVPIKADGYMYIDCFWVSGQFKGQGNANLLLDACIADSREKGKDGLCVLSARKKTAFLSDGDYLRYKGFETADTAEPFFELLYLPFNKNAEVPKFRDNARKPSVTAKGFSLFYTHQCPYTAKYVPLIAQVAEKMNVPFTAVCYESAEQAQASPLAFTTYGLFYNGEFVTHEILSEKKFEKIVKEHI